MFPTLRRAHALRLERSPPKWMPARRKRVPQNKDLEPFPIATRSGTALLAALSQVALAGVAWADAVTAPQIDGSRVTVTPPGATSAQSLADIAGQSFSVLSFKSPASIDGINDDIAIQAAVDAALAKGTGRVVLPPRTGCYVLAAPIRINPGSPGGSAIILEGSGIGACIKPGRPMESMIVAGGRWLEIRNIQLSNEGRKATNGIELTCTTGTGNQNNRVYIEKNSFLFLVNGIKNTNCDAWTVYKNWFQDNTGWDVLSADNGTASTISDNYSLGSRGNVQYNRQKYAAEGYTISHNIFLPTAGKGIEINACLACSILFNQIDQANETGLKLDGSAHPIADATVEGNWIGVKQGATANDIGLDIVSNVVEARIVNNSTVGWKQCGIRLLGGRYSVQNILISGLRATSNGTGKETGDLCAVPRAGGGGVAYTVRDSWLMSNGAGQHSAVEKPGAVGTWRNNRLASPAIKSDQSSWDDNFGDDRDTLSGKYGAWPRYAAGLTCERGSLGSGVMSQASYTRRSNTVHINLRIVIPNKTAAGNCAGVVFAKLPAALGNGSVAVFAGRNVGAGDRPIQGWATGGAAVAVTDMAGNTVATGGADLILSGTYEAMP